MKLFLALLLFISVRVFAGPYFEIKTQEQFEAYLTEARFSGVLAVAKGETILFKKAFGVHDFVTNVPNSVTDKFQIGSVSKQFTAAAILKLQEAHKLSTDDEVTKYLPDMKYLAGIKIRDVLNHTAGVANYTDQPEFWNSWIGKHESVTYDEILDFINGLPLDFSPRSAWKYSNSGYIIAGRIVEVVSGQKWDEYLKNNFLDALQMKDTGFSEKFSSVSPVVGHEDFAPDPEFNMTWALAAGGLYSTVDDLLKWTDIYASSDLLTQASKDEMQTPFLSNYGYGVFNLPFNNEVEIWHNGRTPGFVTSLIYLKSSRLKVAKVDNNDGGMVEVASLALNFFSTGSAQALKIKPFSLDPAALDAFVGVYKGQKLTFTVFIKDGALFLQPDDGQPAYQLVPNDRDCFRLAGLGGEEFIRDEKGVIVGLKHYQGNSVSAFSKIK